MISRYFIGVADKFVFRLGIYFFLVLLAGFFAFTEELIMEQYGFTLMNHAVADGLVTGFAVIIGLCLFEVFLYGSRRWKSRLDAEARKADIMLTTIVQTIPDLVFVKDIEGRHLMVNKAVEEFTGLTAKQLHGKTMAELLPSPHLAEPCMQSDRKSIVTGKCYRVEERYANAGGLRNFDTIKIPLRDELGGIVGIVGVSRDIMEKLRADEERHLLQRQLLHAQKMEALGHLAGGVAHDFNNILTVIVGYAEILKRALANDYILKHHVDEIHDASQRAKTLIKGLFTFSSKQKIDTKPLNLNDIISDGRRLILQLISERISFKMNCCDTPLTVMVDQPQLERVLLNLAANARDAMPDGGDLVFSTGSFKMGDDFVQKHGYGVPGNYALLAVSDTGTGISEEHKKRIFEPFFTTKEAGKGTGLGLSIVYGIIKQHGGFINVSSDQGRGTTFRVFLPIAKDPLQLPGEI
jgi:PAS domain S-box-containing protein